MRAADPVENSGTAEVVHLDHTAGSHKPAPVYSQRRTIRDDDASGAFPLEIDVRSASSQLYQWIVIFAVAGLAIGGAKWWSARQGEAIARLAAAPAALTTMEQATGGASRSTSDDGTVSAVDPSAAGTQSASATGAGEPQMPGVAPWTLDEGASPDGSAPGSTPAGVSDDPAGIDDGLADQDAGTTQELFDTADVRTVRAPADVPYPRRVEGVDPDVPEGAAVRRGIAVLSLLIDARGNVVEAELLRNVDPMLDDAALSAARLWKFEPTMKDGRPVAVRSNVTVRFGYD